jgi:NodT family efflux transporter outer membrane factor (OMF) lipoprotein
MKSVTRPAALLAPLLVLAYAGCTSLPMPALDQSVPPAWRHMPTPAAPTPDLQGWWHSFDDPALDALVQRALAENLGLRAASERLLAARVLRAHARDAFLPYLRAHTEDAIDPSAAAAFVVYSFDASWEMGLFGRREGTSRVLRAEAADATAGMAGAEVSLVAEVVADYLLLGAGQERLLLLSHTRALHEQQLSLLKSRADLGLASPLEVAEAESDLAHARATEASGQQQVDAAAAQLAALLGRSAPDPGWLEGGHLARLQVPAIPSAPAELLRTRPEIRQAEAAVLAAAGAAELARADRFPSVGIGGSIRWSVNVSHNRPNAPPNFDIASAGPLLDIPLFDWGLRRARAESKSHLLGAATLEYRDAVLHGVAEVETALGNLQRDTLREGEAEQAAGALQRAAASASQRSQLQLLSPLAANSAGLAALDGELALIDARTERGMSYVALYKALGGAPRPPIGL